MSRLPGLSVVLAFLMPVCHAQEPRNAIVFNTDEYDFGEIADPTRPLSCTFMFMNTSDATVEFASPVPGCSCIKASISPKTVAAGETGEVEVIFDPSGSMFRTYRTVGVYSKDGEHIRTLGVSAYVNSSGLGISERYPIVLGGGLRAARSDVAFGYLYWDEPAVRTIAVINAGNEAIRVDVRAQSPAPGLSVTCPQFLVPGAEGSIVLEYDMTDEAHEYRSGADSMEVLVDGLAVPGGINTSYILMGRLSGDGPHPSLRSYPSVSVLSESGGRYSGEAELYNDGPVPLRIFAVNGEAWTNLRSGTVIEAGGQLKVEAVSDKPSFRLELFTDDPVRPYKELIFKY